jgi:hypothetical protein
MILSRLAGKMLRLRRLVHDHFASRLALGDLLYIYCLLAKEGHACETIV